MCGLLYNYFIVIGHTKGKASLEIEKRSIHSICSKFGQVKCEELVKHHSITVEWVIGCDAAPQERLMGIWFNLHMCLVIKVGRMEWPAKQVRGRGRRGKRRIRKVVS